MPETVRYALDAHVATLTLARSAKRNAFDLTMLRTLAEADPEPGLGFRLLTMFPEGGVDPLGLYGRRR